MALGLSCIDFFHKAEELYISQISPDNHTWPTAMHAKNLKVVPDNFGLLSEKLHHNKNTDENKNSITMVNGNGNNFLLLKVEPPSAVVRGRDP